MSVQTTTTSPLPEAGELRMLPLSRINIREGFNPRRKRDSEKFAQTKASIDAHGVLQPILVRPDGEGEYSLVAGEGRYLACAELGHTEIPSLIREVDETTGGLAEAAIENIVRDQLDPVEEALLCQRLMTEAGLTQRGVAERLKQSARWVRERIQILKLPNDLQELVADHELPLSAVPALVKLAAVEPALASLAAGRARDADNELTWSRLAEDPIRSVTSAWGNEQLPVGIYEDGVGYPLKAFSLTDQAQRDRATLARAHRLSDCVAFTSSHWRPRASSVPCT